MTINVYWACLEEEWMRAEEPAPVLSQFIKQHSNEKSLISCPAVKNALTNHYSIKSLYDYEFFVSDNSASSQMYTQEFFDTHITIRNLEERLFSFSQQFIFFTDEPSLLMTGNLMPYLEKNNVTKTCIPVPGLYDIGKWFRQIEFAFFMPKDVDTFKISQGEVFQYIHFHTDKKINLIQFTPSNHLMRILNDVHKSRNYKKFMPYLDYFYKTFKLKPQLLREIKENIL